MHRMRWILSGILLLGTAAGFVSACRKSKDPCLAQRESVDKAKAAVTAAGATYRTLAERRRQAYDLWLKAEAAAGRKRETWQAASESATKLRDAYDACLEKSSAKSCAGEKSAADEAVLQAARECRDTVFADLDASCARTALDEAEGEAQGAGEAHQAAIKTLQDALAALSRCSGQAKK